MVLAPGESTTVTSGEYTMPEGMGGPHDFAIHLVTNDPETPDRVVNVVTLWGP
jgi:hypothetical protein